MRALLRTHSKIETKEHSTFSPRPFNSSSPLISYIYFSHTDDKDFQYPVLVPLKSAAHGGDDVAVFATGPWAHLFTGIYEQNVIPHFMAFASCIGDELTACNG